MKERVHEKILTHCDALVHWYENRLRDAYIPFYSSYDVRDASFKISNVDGNIFPAGFNNICQTDKENTHGLPHRKCYLKLKMLLKRSKAKF